MLVGGGGRGEAWVPEWVLRRAVRKGIWGPNLKATRGPIAGRGSQTAGISCSCGQGQGFAGTWAWVPLLPMLSPPSASTTDPTRHTGHFQRGLCLGGPHPIWDP